MVRLDTVRGVVRSSPIARQLSAVMRAFQTFHLTEKSVGTGPGYCGLTAQAVQCSEALAHSDAVGDTRGLIYKRRYAILSASVMPLVEWQYDAWRFWFCRKG